MLALSYTVIAPDPRGYGYAEEANTGYDKHTTAAGIRALMAPWDTTAPP